MRCIFPGILGGQPHGGAVNNESRLTIHSEAAAGEATLPLLRLQPLSHSEREPLNSSKA
eukprot:SAG11_NODE_19509_length_465_cov_0.852459_1_plen_58_part_01